MVVPSRTVPAATPVIKPSPHSKSLVESKPSALVALVYSPPLQNFIPCSDQIKSAKLGTSATAPAAFVVWREALVGIPELNAKLISGASA